MLNPADAFNTGSYVDLRGRVLKRMKSSNVYDHVFQVVQDSYEKALAADHLVLSRAEKRRPLANVLKSALEDLNQRLRKS